MIAIPGNREELVDEDQVARAHRLTSGQFRQSGYCGVLSLPGPSNACPHLRLPLSDSTVTDDETIVCRWHESRFDLNSGEILDWCPALADDGTPKGMEHLGNVSKNRTPMSPLPVRAHDGHIWVAID